MDDGNVILFTDKTLYRVHKSVLASQSAFFKDMFSLPAPAAPDGADGVYDGVKTVKMVGDLDEDVGCLLTMLYDSRYVWS